MKNTFITLIPYLLMLIIALVISKTTNLFHFSFITWLWGYSAGIIQCMVLDCLQWLNEERPNV